MRGRRRSKPGRRYRIRIQMNDITQTFPKGHRIRLAISGFVLAHRLAFARRRRA